VRHRRARKRLALALAAAAIGIWLVIALAGAFPGDRLTAAAIRNHPPGRVSPANALSWLGALPVSAFVVAALAAYSWNTFGPRHAVLIAATALGASAATRITKLVVDRARPEGAQPGDVSFPSGHTVGTTAVLGLLAVLLARSGRRRLAMACLVVVAAMGPSRVLVGAHWVSDALAGYLIGLVWLIAVLLLGLPWAGRDRGADASPEPLRLDSGRRFGGGRWSPPAPECDRLVTRCRRGLRRSASWSAVAGSSGA
jgi:membrane-associated phospholipid phosphatase